MGALGTRACVPLLLCACLWPTVCQADAPELPLSILERRAASAIRVVAAGEAVEAARQEVRFETVRSGAQILIQTNLEPQRQIVARNVVDESFRYAHSVGLDFPLYGAKAAEHEAIANAKADETDAEASLDEARRRAVANVREIYVLYWVSERQEELSHAYGEALGKAVPMTQALVRRGFWTQTDALRFREKVASAASDENKAALEKSQALASLRSIVGNDLDNFTPETPETNATVDALQPLLASAARHDLELRHIQGQIDRFSEFERYAKFRSIQSNLTTSLGMTVDMPNGVGYGATAGLTLLLPTHAQQANAAYQQQIDAELQSWRDQQRARSTELNAAVEKAFDERLAALQDLNAAQAQVPFTREDLRETRMRFENIPQTTFNDVLERMAADYASKYNELSLRAAALTKTYELLFLAPEAEKSPVASDEAPAS